MYHRHKPFNGYSAWFAMGVENDAIDKWGQYGGSYRSDEEADFLFSEVAHTHEIRSIYLRHNKAVTVFSPRWIYRVIRQGTNDLSSVPIGKYIQIPSFSLDEEKEVPCTPLTSRARNYGLTPPTTSPLKPLPPIEVEPYSPVATKPHPPVVPKPHPPVKHKPCPKIQPRPHPPRTETFEFTGSFCDIEHYSKRGVVKERLIDAVVNSNGLIVRRIPKGKYLTVNNK